MSMNAMSSPMRVQLSLTTDTATICVPSGTFSNVYDACWTPLVAQVHPFVAIQVERHRDRFVASNGKRPVFSHGIVDDALCRFDERYLRGAREYRRPFMQIFQAHHIQNCSNRLTPVDAVHV